MNIENKKIGGHLLADQLNINGVDTIFCVPGESYLGLLDGLYSHSNQIKLITTRHESGAANMADAYAKLTNKPGICLVSRGPGATNASNGIHTAYQDSTPLILLIGQVSRNERDREAQQEIDYKEMFKPMAKYVAEINDANRIPEFINKAFYISQSGRPAPVVLSLPEDMLIDEVIAKTTPASKIVQAIPSVADVNKFFDKLKIAKKPIIIIGGNTWSQEAINKVTNFVNKNSIPVLTSYRAQDRFDNRNENYIGHSSYAISSKTKKRIQDSDFILSLGARLGEVTTQGYSTLNVPKMDQYLVHVHPGIGEIGSVYYPDIAINSGMSECYNFLPSLPQIKNPVWKDGCLKARKKSIHNIKRTPMSGNLNYSEIIEYMTSLANTIEEPELNLLQKDQKIKFRDGQIKNLQTELKKTKLMYNETILELDEIKNDLSALSSNNENLIKPDKLKLLEDKFTKLNIENDKNITNIINLNKKIDDLNNVIALSDNKTNDVINENKKLKKDNKNICAKKIKLDNDIIELKEKISEQQIEIDSYLEEIKKLKDKSHHGG